MSLFFRRFVSTGPKAGAQSLANAAANAAATSAATSATAREDSKNLSTSLFNMLPTPLSRPTRLPKKLGHAYIDNEPTYPWPPRTGVLAGRTVTVPNPAALRLAVRRLDILNRLSNVRRTVFSQERYIRPSKVKYNLKYQRKRREFREGIRNLFGIVREVRRKGY